MKGHKGEDGVIVGSADLDARWSPSAFFEKALSSPKKKKGKSSPKRKKGRGAKKVHPAPTLDEEGGSESKPVLPALEDAFAESEEDEDEEGGDGGGDGFWGH
jgi:hypothetical protein